MSAPEMILILEVAIGVFLGGAALAIVRAAIKEFEQERLRKEIWRVQERSRGSSERVRRSQESPDSWGAPWYQFSQEIDELLATGKYAWAEDVLLDIQTTVKRTKRVTDGVRLAVANVRAAGERAAE